jgi:hypothetical protein
MQKKHNNYVFSWFFYIVWARAAGAIRATIWKLLWGFGWDCSLLWTMQKNKETNTLNVYFALFAQGLLARFGV